MVGPGRPERVTPLKPKAVAYIRAYVRERGYPPSMREIAAHLRVGLATAQTILIRLEEEGLLTRQAYIPRSIRLVKR